MAAGVQFNLPFSIGIGDTPPDGLDDKVRPIAVELYNALTQILLAFHNTLGVGQQLQTMWDVLTYAQTLHQHSATRYYAKASEAIAYGAAVNLHSTGGVLKARNANATNTTKPCHGFCTVTGGVALDAYLEVILFRGVLTGFSGLVQGSRYFLSTTNGLVTAVAPVAAGNIEQVLGIALSDSVLLYDFNLYYVPH